MERDIDTTTAPTATTTDEDGVTTTTVNGVRTLLAPRSGPVTAGLLFRVGRADETLATSGITHLVEHLALHRHGLSDLHYNGATAAAYTHFAVTGTADDVVEYLNGVCAALRDLPVDRLETEKEILRTEAAGRGCGAADGMGVWRYGARSSSVVRMPPRDPARIPRPDPARSRPRTSGKADRNGAVTAWIWLLGTLTVILTAATGLVAFAETDPELSPEGPDWAAVFFMSLLTAICAYPWIEYLRKRRRGEG